jgi:GNAT superfamily N-acetyltransferase
MGTTSVRLRPFREEDLDLLARDAIDPAFSMPFEWTGYRSPGAYRRRWEEDGFLDKDPHHLVIADHDDVGVGWVTWQDANMFGRQGWAWVIGIILAPEHRGRGVGTVAQRLLAEHLFDTTVVHRHNADLVQLSRPGAVSLPDGQIAVSHGELEENQPNQIGDGADIRLGTATGVGGPALSVISAPGSPAPFDVVRSVTAQNSSVGIGSSNDAEVSPLIVTHELSLLGSTVAGTEMGSTLQLAVINGTGAQLRVDGSFAVVSRISELLIDQPGEERARSRARSDSLYRC